MTRHGSTTPVSLDLPQPRFDFDGCAPADLWNAGSPARSHFWNALSSQLPAFEFWAVRWLTPRLDCIDDPKLREEARLFCRQESQHGSAHGRFNTACLHGRYPWLARQEARERRLLQGLSKLLPARLFFALFVAIEHWTAALGQHGLEAPQDWFADTDETLYRLWEWHAAEELAHKAVCHDVHRHLGGGHALRLLGMLLLGPVALPGLLARLAYLHGRDGRLLDARVHRETLRYLLGRRGVVRKLAGDLASYLSPRYEPWRVQSQPLIEAYRSRMADEAEGADLRTGSAASPGSAAA